MYKAHFSLDSINETKHQITPFTGYTTGELWNGWSTPYFPKDEADRLVEALNQVSSEGLYPIMSGVDTFAWYDADKDAYVTVYEEDINEVDVWGVAWIEIDNEIKHLYPIGAYCWTWNTELVQPDAIVDIRKVDWEVADPWLIVSKDFVASASDNPSHPHGVWGLTELTWKGSESFKVDDGDPVTWDDLPYTLRDFLVSYFREDN